MKKLIVGLLLTALLPFASAKPAEALDIEQIYALYPGIPLERAIAYMEALEAREAPPTQTAQAIPPALSPVTPTTTPQPGVPSPPGNVQLGGWDLRQWDYMVPDSIENRLIARGWSFRFDARPNPTIAGQTQTLSQQIVVFLGPRPDGRTQTAAQIGRTIRHEIGHAIDFTVVTPAEREWWRQSRGFRLYWPNRYDIVDLAFGSGDMAEALGWAATGIPGTGIWAITPEQAEFLQTMVARL